MFGKELTQLCMQASQELDGEQLLILAKEINRLLSEREADLKLRTTIVGKRMIAMEREQAS